MSLVRIHRQLVRLAALLGMAEVTSSQAQEPLQRRELVVDGVKREALLYAPDKAKTEASPSSLASTATVET